MNTSTQIKRGAYSEIKMESLDEGTRSAVRTLVENASNAAKIDEHGAWAFKAEFDRKGRGSAINWDLYAVGNDVHSGELLIVIQVRQFERRHKNWYGNVRKNYYLLGTNEDGTTFAHPVSSNVIHAAIRRDADVVLAVQNWIFDGDYANMIRHGDLALVPVKSAPAPLTDRTEMVLENSHQLTAQAIRLNGHLYAKNPTLVHLPGTHPTVSGQGWFRVQVGNRAAFWKFAVPTVD